MPAKTLKIELIRKASTSVEHHRERRKIYMTCAGLEPAISLFDRPKAVRTFHRAEG
jgi:hypothetical protein